MRNRFYFDNAASTSVDSRVLEAMIPYFSDNYGNASSMHFFGAKAKAVLSDARARIAQCINAQPEEIIFTSSGTEANNLALKGIAHAYRGNGKHLIVSSIEHDCILNTCQWLTDQRFEVSYIPVNESGVVDPAILQRMIRKDTLLVSVMHVNNELGTLQPISEIGKICYEHGVLFHSDCCQSFGKTPIDVSRQHIDLLSLNAHKIYGPKGAGALFLRKGVSIAPIFHGGGQESGRRSSTENIPAIVGFAKAAEISIMEMESEYKRISDLQSAFLTHLFGNYESAYLNGDSNERLPYIVNFSFHGLEGETIRLLLLLEEAGIAVSTGSACSSNGNSGNASHVLQAIGLNPFEARGAIRISFGRYNTMDEVWYLSESIGKLLGKLNSIYS